MLMFTTSVTPATEQKKIFQRQDCYLRMDEAYLQRGIGWKLVLEAVLSYLRVDRSRMQTHWHRAPRIAKWNNESPSLKHLWALGTFPSKD